MLAAIDQADDRNLAHQDEQPLTDRDAAEDFSPAPAERRQMPKRCHQSTRPGTPSYRQPLPWSSARLSTCRASLAAISRMNARNQFPAPQRPPCSRSDGTARKASATDAPPHQSDEYARRSQAENGLRRPARLQKEQPLPPHPHRQDQSPPLPENQENSH